MESNTFKLLESTTIKTLHAHSFTRSSTQASLVLTDLLARYLSLLTSTCAQYAQHAGRTNLTARDALSALDDMGVSVDELGDYVSEGLELGRYATQTARRVEELNEIKAALREGLPVSHEGIPLEYAPLPDFLPEDREDEDEEDVSMDENAPGEVEPGREEDMMEVERTMKILDQDRAELLDGFPPLKRAARPVLEPPAPPLQPPTPPLPLSPVSNPCSPSRKRLRTEKWHPPDHIPDFLPPFPSSSRISPEPEPLSLPPLALRNPGADRPPSPPRHSSTASADYATAVPYAESSLAESPEWHLPASLLSTPTPLSISHPHLPTPQVPPSLIAAYHHILTNPPPANSNVANPSRHRVAMALLEQTQKKSRWEPADTLYANVAPNLPTVAPFGPSFPVPVNAPSPNEKDEDGKDKDKKMQSAIAKSIAAIERVAPLASFQGSRISELARDVLPGQVLRRTTRLNHPPVLIRNSEKLTYGPGVPAHWNKTAVPILPAGVTAGPTPTVNLSNGVPNGKGKEKAKDSDKDKDKLANGEAAEKDRVWPDARFYATWEYEQKSFRAELVPPRKAKQGGFQSNMFAPGVKRSASESHGWGS